MGREIGVYRSRKSVLRKAQRIADASTRPNRLMSMNSTQKRQNKKATRDTVWINHKSTSVRPSRGIETKNKALELQEPGLYNAWTSGGPLRRCYRVRTRISQAGSRARGLGLCRANSRALLVPGRRPRDTSIDDQHRHNHCHPSSRRTGQHDKHHPRLGCIYRSDTWGI